MALRTPPKCPKLANSAPTPPLVLNLSPPGGQLSPHSHTVQLSYDGLTCEFPKEPPQKYVCSVCTQLVKDPHLTACCGHEFCQSCLEEWERKSGAKSCPHCRHENYVHILNKQTRREVEELRVLCSKRGQGCGWEGELGVFGAHLRDCEYTPVKCCNCSLSIPRKNFEKHSTSECAFRESKCVYCNREDAYIKVISFVHLAECPGYPMGCPNNCGVTNIKRCKLATHRESCPLEEIHCPMKSAGCPRKLLRKDLEAHVATDQTQHLLLLMSGFQKSQMELQAQRKELKELKMFKVAVSESVERVSSSMDQLLRKSLTTDVVPLRSIRALLASSRAMILNADHSEISLILPNFSQLEKKTLTSWESVPFFLGPGYKVCLAFVQRLAKFNELAAEVRLLPGEFDDELSWPCSIDFSNIYMSLSPVQDGNKSDTIDTISSSKRFQPSFNLLTKGKAYSGIARCPPTSPFHHVLWQTEKVMDPLPPFPSAIRGVYLQNDCLTVTLTWGPPRGTLDFSKDFSKLSIERGSRTPKGRGDGVVREGGVAVCTTASSGGARASDRIVRRTRRKK